MPSARELKMLQLIEARKKAAASQEDTPAQDTESSVTIPDSQEIETPSASADNEPEVIETPSTSADNEPEATETEEDTPYFQALGTLYGSISPHPEGGFAVTLEDKSYRLYLPKYRYIGFSKQVESNPETPLYLRVYPKCRIIPRQPPQIYFQVLAWDEENQWEEEPEKFILKGIWQFIPQNRGPVMSIYRNKGANDPTKKFKAAHIPVLMRREGEVQPFKFNPKVPKEELPKRWFLQGVFKFIPSRNSFGWVEDIVPPTDYIPRYKKPVKATANPPEKS